jgi:hypothetical protein
LKDSKATKIRLSSGGEKKIGNVCMTGRRWRQEAANTLMPRQPNKHEQMAWNNKEA